METINSFINEYDFLSLEYPFEYELYNVNFKNLAQYYYGFKCNFIEPMRKLVQSNLSPELFILKLKPELIRPDWLKVRERILNHGLYMKFLNPDLQTKLLDTGDKKLIYGFTIKNPSNDLLFLGKSLETDEGENNLGKQLMQVRLYFKTLKLHTLINSSVEYNYGK